MTKRTIAILALAAALAACTPGASPTPSLNVSSPSPAGDASPSGMDMESPSGMDMESPSGMDMESPSGMDMESPSAAAS